MSTELKNFYEVKNTPNGKTSAGVSYSDFSNGEFAYRMWEKQKEDAETSGEDAMPLGVWADAVGLNNEDFNAAFEIGMGDNFDPTNRPIPQEWASTLDDKARLVFQGQTFGWGDEIQGAMGALGDVLSGRADEQSFGDLYTQYRDSERTKIKEFRTNQPIHALKYELGGALVSPLGIFKAPKLIKQGYETLSAGKKAMVTSGTVGTVYGGGTSEEETVSGVAEDALTTGVATSLFGLGLQKTIPLFGKAKEKLAGLFKRNNENPTISTLRQLKNTAYSTVGKSKARFDNDDFNGMLIEAKRIAQEGHHTEVKDKAVTAALNIFKSLKQGKTGYTLTQMDRVKQSLSTLYNKNPEQKMLLDMMDVVDDAIRAKGAVFPELEAARVANTLYKKAEKLDEIFQSVVRNKKAFPFQSEVDLYKTAVLNLLNNKQAIKYFSIEEKQMMEQFIKGGVIERTMQRAAKLAPSSNKLLTMLAFAGSYFQPLFLVPIGIGMVAKRIADPAIRNKAFEMINTVGKVPPKDVIPGMKFAGSGGSAVIASQKE